ncbi:hypothetical protein NTE10_000451 [Vibrio harveyi]|uniref:hypothetical protein n=1 Tax=Vibrio parahaemolyticus TaxID=670 RepID=UPI0005F15769|nr:hypothetical protein [Vibrio parahaemolyticus]EKO3808592.1 hypothetical protein [Vibrio harveyi]
MLYEKKNKKSSVILDVLVYGAVAVICVIYFTYIYVSVVTITDEEVKVSEISSSLAQIATASAFIFAVHQYRKNGEKERQTIIATEAKSIVQRMSKLSDGMLEKRGFTSSDINKFTNAMSNLGTDFYALYDALSDDVQKAIIRMYWQNMHFNHLSIALKSLTIESLFSNMNLDREHKGESFFDAQFDDSVTSQPDAFKEYAFTKKVFEKMSVCDSIVSGFDDLFLFETYYFSSKKIDDLMYGSMSRLDIRVKAPLLAVIREKQS